jgi:hypothetical protein
LVKEFQSDHKKDLTPVKTSRFNSKENDNLSLVLEIEEKDD